MRKWLHNRRGPLGLIALTLVGLALRLLAWRWSELRPLGGDEQEYLNLAIHLAQGQGYYDLQLMRPPLFPAGLAALVWLFDGNLQLLRLANGLVSAATIPLSFWWTRQLGAAWQPDRSTDWRRAAWWAAILTAGCYTLALNATELLTETVFLAGLTLFWPLLIRAGQQPSWRRIGLAGLTLGGLCLIRSVALPLLLLGSWWLWLNAPRRPEPTRRMLRLAAPLLLCCATLLPIAPWTVRNAVRYGGLILIDPTGPENLWLDNDPRGREAVKAELYALGERRVERQQLATQRGVAAIRANPGWFAAKSWREFTRFWALEQADDLLQRRAIWVSPAETWLRLGLGDGLWLVLLLAGVTALFVLPAPAAPGLRWLLLGWALYTLATGALFHVELRYRLPIYPILLPWAGWTLARIGRWLDTRLHQQPAPGSRQHFFSSPGHGLGWALSVAGLLALTLLNHNYLAEGLRLGQKHLALWQAERSLALGLHDFTQARAARVLQLDPESALARTLLARVDLAQGRPDRAKLHLHAAIAALPAHPYAHLLRGDLLRAEGDSSSARRELSYETASREDLQRWARRRLTQTPLTTTLDLGSGLDLGLLEGFHSAEADSTRWTRATATIYLAPGAGSDLVLRIAAQRPAGAPPPALKLKLNGVAAGTFALSNAWQELVIPLPATLDRSAQLEIQLASATFSPHTYDRFNPDGRELGLRLDWAQVR